MKFETLMGARLEAAFERWFLSQFHAKILFPLISGLVVCPMGLYLISRCAWTP
jgi:hypothetical protein